MAGGTWDMDSLTSIRGEARMYESTQKLGGGLKDFFWTSIFFRWVVQPPTSQLLYCKDFLGGSLHL